MSVSVTVTASVEMSILSTVIKMIVGKFKEGGLAGKHALRGIRAFVTRCRAGIVRLG